MTESPLWWRRQAEKHARSATLPVPADVRHSAAATSLFFSLLSGRSNAARPMDMYNVQGEQLPASPVSILPWTRSPLVSSGRWGRTKEEAQHLMPRSQAAGHLQCTSSEK